MVYKPLTSDEIVLLNCMERSFIAVGRCWRISYRCRVPEKRLRYQSALGLFRRLRPTQRTSDTEEVLAAR